MKIKPEHYAKIANDCAAVIAAHPTALQEYKNAGLSATRYRWDVARKAGLIRFFCDEVYKYANDTHIDTALRNAITF